MVVSSHLKSSLYLSHVPLNLRCLNSLWTALVPNFVFDVLYITTTIIFILHKFNIRQHATCEKLVHQLICGLAHIKCHGIETILLSFHILIDKVKMKNKVAKNFLNNINKLVS